MYVKDSMHVSVKGLKKGTKRKNNFNYISLLAKELSINDK